jgi:N-acetylglucosamine malate deacetylase 1
MTLADRFGATLVLAPHPDDEVLGCGGTIARLVAEGAQVDVAIVTRGMAPAYSDDQVAEVRAEAEAAHRLLGVTGPHYLDLPAAGLDTIPQALVNKTVAALVGKIRPATLLVPFLGDIHADHQIVFNAAMVASRPAGGFRPDRVLAYETLSETNWSAPYLSPAFAPTTFIDIGGFVEAKIAAFGCYASQVRPFPNERSVESLRALAALRGSCVNLHAAEAFVLLREIAVQ